MILCSNPKFQYLSHKKEIDRAISTTLNSGDYILGNQVQLFESEFAKYIGSEFGIGVGSGTEAIHIALRACGIGPGDEVITVSHTAIATIAAVEIVGAKPVLVDIETDYYTLDPKLIEKAISKNTKAIIPVHLYGQPAEMKPILKIARKYRLKIIEDCCQAHGAIYHNKKVGSWGDVGCFSFYPTKNLGALGDGGMIVTNNKKFACKCRLLRQYGWSKRYISHLAGWNSRLDELQAVILRIKLKYLDKDNRQRNRISCYYEKKIYNKAIIHPKKKENQFDVYHLYVIRTTKREFLRRYLLKKGIQSLIHYPIPVHLQPAYRRKIRISGKLTNTETIAKEILSLPIYPELSKIELNQIVNVINHFK